MRHLIVNADDFGQAAGINRGVITAHEYGIVTSASLMVRWDAAREAASYARRHPELSVGLHLDLGEWTYRDGAWCALYEVVRPDDAGAIAEELARQLDRFCELLGVPPTHLDSHQHVHQREPARSAVLDCAQKWGVPVRSLTPGLRYCGAFYGQTSEGLPYPEGITADNLIRILEELPGGCTELACHPGQAGAVQGMYQHEREQEVRSLCDPRVRSALHALGITLGSFHNFHLGVSVGG